MLTVEEIRAEHCLDCGARPGEPCIVRGRTAEAQEHAARRLVRITAGVRVHPARWVAAVESYRKVAS